MGSGSTRRSACVSRLEYGGQLLETVSARAIGTWIREGGGVGSGDSNVWGESILAKFKCFYLVMSLKVYQ